MSSEDELRVKRCPQQPQKLERWLHPNLLPLQGRTPRSCDLLEDPPRPPPGHVSRKEAFWPGCEAAVGTHRLIEKNKNRRGEGALSPLYNPPQCRERAGRARAGDVHHCYTTHCPLWTQRAQHRSRIKLHTRLKTCAGRQVRFRLGSRQILGLTTNKTVQKHVDHWES